MNKILRIILLSLVSVFTINIANAFGYFKSTDIYDFMGMPGFGVIMGFGLIAIVVGILLFVFWLLMLVDCLKRDFKKDYEKIVWVLVMIFLHILGAIIYYFVVKVDHKAAKAEKKK